MASVAPPAAQPAADLAGRTRRASHGGHHALFKKLLLSFLGIGVVGSIAARTQLGTLSTFTATTTNPGTTFTAGTLFMSNSLSSGTLTVTGLVPGTNTAIQTATVTIVNSGTLPATYSLIESSASSTLGKYLNLAIQEDSASSGPYIYGSAADVASSQTATVAEFNSAGTISIPGTGGTTWASAESHTFTFTVQFPLLSDLTTLDSLTGLAASATFTWNATQ